MRQVSFTYTHKRTGRVISFDRKVPDWVAKVIWRATVFATRNSPYREFHTTTGK